MSYNQVAFELSPLRSIVVSSTDPTLSERKGHATNFLPVLNQMSFFFEQANQISGVQ